MEAKVEDLAKGKIKLKILVSPKEMVGFFNRSYEKIAPTIKLDGFRPGKVPRALVEGAAGVARILSEGLDLAIQETYFETIKEHKIVPITSPKIVINKYPNYGATEEDVKEYLEFEAELEVLPEVKLRDYSKIKVEKGEVKKSSNEEIEKVLQHFQKQNAKFNETDRAAKMGDWVEITYTGSLDHVKIDQMSSKNHPLVLGEGNLIPGFEEKIVDMKKGEKKKFKIKFPKDYHSKEYAGAEAEFEVELINVKEIELPEINGAFAEKFGHKDVTELKDAIKKNMDQEYEQEFERDLEIKVLDKVLPLLEVEIPESLVQGEIERMISDFAAQVGTQGLNFEQYLSGIKKTREDLKKEMGPQAEKNVKIGLILGKIIEENKWDHHDKDSGKKAIDYLVNKLTK